MQNIPLPEVRALLVPCPACGAQPGASCLAPRTPVDPETRMEIPSAKPALYKRSPHLKRLELAKRSPS